MAVEGTVLEPPTQKKQSCPDHQKTTKSQAILVSAWTQTAFFLNAKLNLTC